MGIAWTDCLGGVRHAQWFCWDDEVIGLEVEDFLALGWEWHVWHSEADVPSRNGSADSLDSAKTQAERALSEMLVELGVCPACR